MRSDKPVDPAEARAHGVIVAVKHLAWFTDHEIQCADGCYGPEPHIDEFRAVDVRPTSSATKARKETEPIDVGSRVRVKVGSRDKGVVLFVTVYENHQLSGASRRICTVLWPGADTSEESVADLELTE